MSDILTRLLLNTSDYDSKLKRAKGSTNDFASNIGGKAAAAIGKFAAGIGVAMGATEAFNRTIQSTQTLGDTWNNTINACKGTVDAFFQSLALGDWGAFNQGLSGTIENMYRVSALKDMLDDAKLTMGFDTKQFEREYVRLEGIIDDETKGKGEREAAFLEMEQLIARFKDRVKKTAEGAAETLVAEMNAKFGQNFTLKDLEKYITEVNNEFLNTDTLQDLNKYKKALENFKSGSFVIEGKILNIDQFKAQNAELEKMRLLQEDNDESRKNMLAQLEYAIELQRQGDEFLKRSLEKQNKIINLNKGGGGSVSQSPIDGSIAALDAEIKAAQVEYANTASEAARKAALQTIELLQNKKGLIELHARVSMPEVGDGKSGSFVAALAGGNQSLKKLELPEFQKKTEDVEDMNAALTETANIFGSLGSIAAASGDDFFTATMSAMGNISQMIMQLQALSTAQATASASKVPFPGNLAAIATVVATIASVFASLPKFAEGGVVGGSSYFGDKLLARVNSGETILTQAQSARALSLMGGGNVRVSGDVRLNGKDIYISLRNYLSASGNKL